MDAYDGSLTAFLLALDSFAIKRGKNGEEVDGNDYTDLQHLLYLRGEHDIIVSNDDIYMFITLPQQRMKAEEFKKLFYLL